MTEPRGQRLKFSLEETLAMLKEFEDSPQGVVIIPRADYNQLIEEIKWLYGIQDTAVAVYDMICEGVIPAPTHPLMLTIAEAELSGYRSIDCPNCTRRRVLREGVCEKCNWDIDNGDYASNTRPEEDVYFYDTNNPTRWDGLSRKR